MTTTGTGEGAELAVLDDIRARRNSLSVRRVFSDRYTVDDVTIIPVAEVAGGGGGEGTGPDDEGGHGFGTGFGPVPDLSASTKSLTDTSPGNQPSTPIASHEATGSRRRPHCLPRLRRDPA